MKIAVGIDDSSPSVTRVRSARALAEQFDGDLHVVFVAHVPATVLAVMSGLPTIGDDFVKAQRANVWKEIEPLLEGCERPVERVDLEGYPPDVFVEYGDEQAIDLKVVGSRGGATLLRSCSEARVIGW